MIEVDRISEVVLSIFNMAPPIGKHLLTLAKGYRHILSYIASLCNLWLVNLQKLSISYGDSEVWIFTLFIYRGGHGYQVSVYQIRSVS